MPENNTPTNVEASVAQGITQLMTKKVGIVCVGIWAVTRLTDPIVQATDPVVRYCLVALGMGIILLVGYAFRGQMKLDLREIEVTGSDQPDNGKSANNGTVKP
jgi:hypothetical protein